MDDVAMQGQNLQHKDIPVISPGNKIRKHLNLSYICWLYVCLCFILMGKNNQKNIMFHNLMETLRQGCQTGGGCVTLRPPPPQLCEGKICRNRSCDGNVRPRIWHPCSKKWMTSELNVKPLCNSCIIFFSIMWLQESLLNYTFISGWLRTLFFKSNSRSLIWSILSFKQAWTE